MLWPRRFVVLIGVLIVLLFLYFVFTDASEVKNGFSLLNIQNFNSSSESVDEIINVLNFNSNFSRDVLNDTFSFTSPNMTSLLCPETPPDLIGPVRVYMDAPSFDELDNLFPWLDDGGHGYPENCLSRSRVAIIIPYRNRENQLRIFLHNIHSFLRKQQLDYSVFVIDQRENQTFNRGKLMNVGFKIASSLYDFKCFIFHDVDLLPEDDRNLYSCPQQPRHMSVAIDKFSYKLPYGSIFGGVSAMSKQQLLKMNGYSNDYWGWGGEDDDISSRVIYAGYKISRYPVKIARYKMMKHKTEATNPVNSCRWKLMKMTKQRYRIDGLSNVNFKVLSFHHSRTHIRVAVDLLEDKLRPKIAEEFRSKDCKWTKG